MIDKLSNSGIEMGFKKLALFKTTQKFMNDEGLYLDAKMIFKSYPVVFIPWSSIRENKKERLYGWKAIQMEF